jgi:hypothetical protein
VVHFREVERSPANGTLSKSQARCIELAAGKVRIAAAIAEDAMTITPLALVEGLSSIRCRFLKHDSPHRTMVEIAQRKE